VRAQPKFAALAVIGGATRSVAAPSQPVRDDPGAVPVAAFEIAAMRQRSKRPLPARPTQLPVSIATIASLAFRLPVAQEPAIAFVATHSFGIAAARDPIVFAIARQPPPGTRK
jgi:hypothetical protein